MGATDRNPFSRPQVLLPLAPLSRAENPEAILRQAAEQIDEIPDRTTQSNLSASTAILAGLVLEKGLIQQILRRELMQESVIYQDILEEGLREGLQQGPSAGGNVFRTAFAESALRQPAH